MFYEYVVNIIYTQKIYFKIYNSLDMMGKYIPVKL